jgi:hypothetical protein
MWESGKQAREGVYKIRVPSAIQDISLPSSTQPTLHTQHTIIVCYSKHHKTFITLIRPQGLNRYLSIFALEHVSCVQAFL